jgi:SagB-type dehydrogenase family enzyme
MRTDRRGFMRVLAGALGLLAGGRASAAARDWTGEIHRETRNTLLGPVGLLRPRMPRRVRRTKDYPGAPRVALPPAMAEQTRSLSEVMADYQVARALAPQPLALAELSRLLHFSNGVTGEPAGDGFKLRAAPSAGALYAGEVYVVAERVDGLEPGVYYYDPVRHSLVPIRLGAQLEVVRRALERPQGVAGAPAALLLTNVFDRYGWRYANRGYRYALIDSGHIGENLRLASRSARLSEVSPLRFEDDRLNALLEIDGREEAVCALHWIGRPAPADTAAGPLLRHFDEQQIAAPAALEASRRVTERYHAATKLVSVAPPEASAPTTATGAAGAAEEKRGARPETSVEECILRRRSARVFRPKPVARPTLDWIVEAAAGHPALVRAPGVELQVVVHRVADLARGLYRVDPADAGLIALRRGDLRRPLARVCLGQDKAGSCAAAFLMVAQLRGAGLPSGDRRYRDQLLESGAIGQRIYLAAEATGVAARNLAAFRDDELNELLGLDGRERAVIHLTVVGYEPANADSG